MEQLGGQRICNLLCIDTLKKTEEDFIKWLIEDVFMNIKRTSKSNIKNTNIVKYTEQIGDVEEQEEILEMQNEINDGNKMQSSTQESNQKKQGYKIVGSHSGVKVCRWTKSMQRGRGGCYKYTFYGIESHRCMEMTPSLACANKCVFCWRHHTNPVSKEWKWTMDEPEFIVNEVIKNHIQQMNTMKGVPGVQENRQKESMIPKHCALSLVGEPIMYPKISEQVDLLHNKSISTFLVTNAQFPDNLYTLVPVTQQYVSIDAPNRETLLEVDRPQHEDFWERYINSQKIINTKIQRTVYRLTLVKGNNMSNLLGYVKLIQIGKPTFIEIKGVTYSGNTDTLHMINVPYHHEVVEFCQELQRQLNDEYMQACEHQHSCCVLLSHRDMFTSDNQACTWIDYPKFFELYKIWKDTGKEFHAKDYSIPTPSWSLFGSKEAGFNPMDTRVKPKGRRRDGRGIPEYV